MIAQVQEAQARQAGVAWDIARATTRPGLIIGPLGAGEVGGAVGEADSDGAIATFRPGVVVGAFLASTPRTRKRPFKRSSLKLTGWNGIWMPFGRASRNSKPGKRNVVRRAWPLLERNLF